ncbi:MAG: PTS transporter subunit EIIA [Erysipelotrichaceae bacterium]|nr:PTS transporter subunit EIIA [Erysipelotrichaceae bacterium]
MNNQRILSILNILNENKYISSEKVANILNLSSKTILNEVKKIKPIIEMNGAIIISKTSIGLKLKIVDRKLFENFYNTLNDSLNKLPRNSEERTYYLLYLFLESNIWIKADDLASELFISRSTLSQNLKNVRSILQKYNLFLESKPNFGLKIRGKELDIRSCIEKEYYLDDSKQSNIVSLLQKEIFEEKEKLEFLIDNAFQKFGFSGNYDQKSSLIINLKTIIDRVKKGVIIKFSDEESEEISYFSTYKIANELLNNIYQEYDIPNNNFNNECIYLTLTLASKSRIEIKKDSNGLIVNNEIKDLVKRMLFAVNESYHLNFIKDLDLKLMLSLHILSLELRIKYNMFFKNPLIEDIKRKFPYSFNISVVAVNEVNRHYKTKITEDEIGYFALYFNLALTKKRRNIEKRNVLIVDSSGRGSEALLSFHLKDNFNKHINIIDSYEPNQLSKIDFLKYDYVVTTQPIYMDIPIPVLEVSALIREADLKELNHFLTIDEYFLIEDFFDKNLFFTDIELNYKEEVISFMVNKIKEYKNEEIGELYQSILLRESQTTTELDYLIAIPHPVEAQTNDTFVSVCILKTPILWKEKYVQLIFLTSLEKNLEANLDTFYIVISRLLTNKEYVTQIIKEKKFDFMMYLLKKIERGSND